MAEHRFSSKPLVDAEGRAWADLGAVAGGGEVGGDRHYDGAGLGQFGVWKCPACGVENVGAFEAGCPSCGAGSAAAYHVGQPPPPPAAIDDARLAPLLGSPAFEAVRGDLQRGMEVYTYAQQWVAAHEYDVPTGLRTEPHALIEAFVAGYQLASAQQQAHTLHAAPVTADLAQLAPEGKVRRTIVAALKLFRDQVLSQSPDEIESGEWCSVAEVDEVLQQLEAE